MTQLGVFAGLFRRDAGQFGAVAAAERAARGGQRQLPNALVQRRLAAGQAFGGQALEQRVVFGIDRNQRAAARGYGIEQQAARPSRWLPCSPAAGACRRGRRRAWTPARPHRQSPRRRYRTGCPRQRWRGPRGRWRRRSERRPPSACATVRPPAQGRRSRPARGGAACTARPARRPGDARSAPWRESAPGGGRSRQRVAADRAGGAEYGNVLHVIQPP